MSLPDQNHIDQVRNALWKRIGGASVMVGAGFSRNSSDVVLGNGTLPVLDNLGRALFKELYPQLGYKDFEESAGRLTRSNDVPKLAQEYVGVGGRESLRQFLSDHISDNRLIPSDVHKRLLNLPWRDVFTTNWDTLLEKSLTAVPERKYSIVRNKDEIPLAGQPRIVKLHGSFPAHFPLICTQEDYRTYPVKFAPFVNTVQQAMMETVFLLIGFSGDDPNFIHWTGWVRDNLGESAPKIYLAGWLDLSLSQRRVLEHRNVVAIDLAHHPKADKWPEHQRHEYATKWILHTLENGRPYEITEWPSPKTLRDKEKPIPDLQPVVEINKGEPEKEPWPTSKSSSGNLLARVDRIINIWAQNRGLYPGWLVVPASVRREFSLKTDDWEPLILEALPKFDHVQQLNMIYELIWRREKLLDPLTKELESNAQDVLLQIDCRKRIINGVSKTEIKWSDVRHDYRNVMLALVTTARLRFDRETFEKRLEALEDFQNDEPDVKQRIHHERCLWAIYSLDYKSLLDFLGNWSPDNGDPFWMVRKATLLYEVNWVDEAKELAARALSAIRRIPNGNRNMIGPSREGWSLESMAVIESTINLIQAGQGKAEYLVDLSRYYRRWRELAPMKCDAPSERREYVNALPFEDNREVVPAFDLGMKTAPSIVFSDKDYRHMKAIHRVIRLSEVAGLPAFRFPKLKTAADELSVSEPEMAVRLILRTADYDKDEFLGRILSRSNVALMPLELARKLADFCDNIIEYALPRIGVVNAGGRNSFYVERMRVAMEVLSRLVIRLKPEDVEKMFSNALAAYENETILRERWLHQPLRNMLRRSWLALPTRRQAEYTFDLISAPILGIGNKAYAHDLYHTGGFLRASADQLGNTVYAHDLYPNPYEFIHERFTLPDRTNENEGRWQQIIIQLAHGLNEDEDVRKRASLWIGQIELWKRLTEKETTTLVQALWNEEFRESNGLPKETSLFDWAFMVLPEPEVGLAEKCFRDKYLSDRENVKENKTTLRDTLSGVGGAISGLKFYGKSLAFSKTEEQFLIDLLWQWTEAPMPAPKEPTHIISLHSVDQFIMSEIEGVSRIISEHEIPINLAEKLYKKREELDDLGFPALGLIPGLSMVLKDQFVELTRVLRHGLISQNENIANEALNALGKWLSLTIEPTSHIQPPPDDLVREIGIMIATRRKEILELALQRAELIFDEGLDTHKQIIQEMTLHGLTYLLDELQYDQINNEKNYDLPNLRYHSARLASSMYMNGFQKEPTINRWLQVAKDDPLPEVRHAIDTF